MKLQIEPTFDYYEVMLYNDRHNGMTSNGIRNHLVEANILTTEEWIKLVEKHHGKTEYYRRGSHSAYHGWKFIFPSKYLAQDFINEIEPLVTAAVMCGVLEDYR